MECARLTLLFPLECVHGVSHTFTPTPETTHSCRQTHTSMHKPLWDQEWEVLMGNVWFLSRLWSRHFSVPTCAPQTKHVDSVRGWICSRESWESQQRSASCCRSSLPCSPTACTLFIQRHGGWTPFTHREESKQRWDTGKKSSRDMQTGVSVWAQTAAEVGLFLELWRIRRWIYISGIPLMSALKRDFCCRSKETLQISIAVLK